MSDSERIAVLAPSGRDGHVTRSVLGGAGIEATIAPDLDALLALLHEGAAAALVAEEALTSASSARLAEYLDRQEPWSDLPVIVFAAPADASGRRRSAVMALAASTNAVVLDRPVALVTLLSSVRSALRARRRQYAARTLLEDLSSAVRARDQFLAMLAHELRNPLAAVLTASELLDRLTPEFPRPRGIISRQARKLSHLVDDLLEASRVTSGKISLRAEPLDLRDVVRRSLEPQEAEFAAAGVELRAALPDVPVTVVGDALRLEQVVGNLLSNAVKYTPRGGHVEVRLEVLPDSAVLGVRDTGVGIPRADAERIFEPFAQVESSLHRSRGGLGLGLSLVRGLVALHGGTVAVRSDGPGTGSDFVVRLPRGRTAAVIARPSVESVEEPASRRVLVIEDQADNREALVMALEQVGHRVLAAQDGPTALDAVARFRPDVAVVDIGLPGLDGYEVARRLRRALGGASRLIALTGYGQEEAVTAAAAAGFDAHLTKPVDLQRLLSVIAG